jgi:glycosyltransferase involved in cell wall biosynthesis
MERKTLPNHSLLTTHFLELPYAKNRWWIRLSRMDVLDEARVFLVHDWLTGMRGGEKCLEVACRRWPNAPLYTLLHRAGTVSPVIETRPVQTSFLQRFPQVHRYYRYLLPFMPLATRSWHLPPCELVLSFSHCVAKAAHIPPGAVHVCYCFTPMRYAWHMRSAYFSEKRFSDPRVLATNFLLERLRRWDQTTADRVDHFIAISRTVQRRISESYHRTCAVIYPPVDTDFYSPSSLRREDYYLAVSAFAPYKRLDLAIHACNQLKRKLVIIGTGQAEARLRELAGPTVQFLGWQSNERVREHFRQCRALLFPGEEDFGIVPLEAQACGTPVIAYGKGGATETIIPPEARQDPTGLFFTQSNVESLVEAMARFETEEREFSPTAARKQAQRFNSQRFSEEFFSFLRGILQTASEPTKRQAA